jgi:formylglycine-generating enzyme required for sulfatase activity
MGIAVAACSPSVKDEPPLGEVLVVVDTDMPVPAFVGRLRVDVYAPDGTWYETRDLARSRVSDWPASFGVYAPDMENERVALVRLRGYPDGKVRDYRGERFAPVPTRATPDTSPDPPATGLPRLVREEDGADITPASEPLPALAIDRLLVVRVRPGVRGAVRVVLRGACVGTMADVANMQSCVDTEHTLVAIDESKLEDPAAPVEPTLAGAFDFSKPCASAARVRTYADDGTPRYDEDVCVPGAMFVFGDPLWRGERSISDVPERVAVVPPFFLDRYEVTVARWRAAVDAGFRTSDGSPFPNEQPLATAPTSLLDGRLCPWSTSPRGREDYALTCLSWASAREFCQFIGGDLPTEVQWEYAAAVAGRPYRTHFPWGNDVPDCTRSIYGRDAPGSPAGGCDDDAKSFGPAPIGARERSGGDVSLGLGFVGLAGGVLEWARDAWAPLTANCWAASPMNARGCDLVSTERAGRGASWAGARFDVYIGRRSYLGAGDRTPWIGLRCARSAAP